METSEGNTQGTSAPPVEGVSGGGTAYGWNDGGYHLNPIRGIVDPTKVPSADLLHVWCMPSTSNVGQQEMPRALEDISLLAARNERESAQIAIRSKVSWGGPGIAGAVQVHCTDLCSHSGDRLIVGEALTWRRVVSILGVPDALVPLDLPVAQINLLPGETTAVWVSIDVPVGHPPGQYEGDVFVTAVKADAKSSVKCLTKAEKHQIFKELTGCLDAVEQTDAKTLEEMEQRLRMTTAGLRKVLLSPTFSECSLDNELDDRMDEDGFTNLSVRFKIKVTVWDFVLPATPSLPAVFGISETVIEDRYGVEHGSDGWYDALEQHFKWFLQYRISPFFCRWGGGMRVLAYTCPWPADHPKSEEYYADPRLAAYAVPFDPIFSSRNAAKDSLRKEVETLKTKAHWKKAYFYLWDEPLNLEQFVSIRNMSSEIRTYALDARVLTTYYCGCTCVSEKSVQLGGSCFGKEHLIGRWTQVPNICTRWWTWVGGN